MNTVGGLLSRAPEFLDAVALDDTRRAIVWTYAQLATAGAAWAANLNAHGLTAGHRVAWRDEDPVVSIQLIIACELASVVACPISPRWPTPTIATSIQQSGIHALIHPSAHGSFDVERQRAVKTRPALSREPELEDFATVLFSSGSTGRPKAIAHYRSSHVMSAQGTIDHLQLRPQDRWLLSLPLYHVAGLGILFRCLLSGATIVVSDRGLAAITADNPLCLTHVSLVPTQLYRILDRQTTAPKRLKLAVMGGAPCPDALLDAATAAGWPLVNTYGLTETASQVTATRIAAARSELSTSGVVLPHRELTITATGELSVRGAVLLAGYLEQGQLQQPFVDGGWFLTGDLGYWDALGRLVVTGRKDNMFISGGENIHPEQIERAILRLPGVRQVIVVPIPNPEFGARPVAFIDTQRSVEPQVWTALLQTELPRFMLPDQLFRWVTSSQMKPNRAELAELAASGRALPLT